MMAVTFVAAGVGVKGRGSGAGPGQDSGVCAGRSGCRRGSPSVERNWAAASVLSQWGACQGEGPSPGHHAQQVVMLV